MIEVLTFIALYCTPYVETHGSDVVPPTNFIWTCMKKEVSISDR